MSDRITRVKSLNLTNFRGFIGEKTVNTDADVVFLSGPNGSGKTSLIDALCLVLTGHHYREREPLISYGGNGGRVAADVSLLLDQQKSIEAILRRSGAKCVIDWNGSRELKIDEDFKSLHARASFYYQDILKYLFEEEEAEVYLEEFLLASDVSVEEVRGACKYGLSLVERFEESLVTRSGLRSEAEIDLERSSKARELEETLDAASSEISEVLTDLGVTDSVPRCSLTIHSGAMRKQWKENLVRLANDYLQYLRFDTIRELTKESLGSLILLSLGDAFERLVDHRRQMRSKESSLQQLIAAFFAERSEGKEPVTQVVVTEKGIRELELECEQLVKKAEELAKERDLMERSLKHYESTEETPGLEQILTGLRQRGAHWLFEGRPWEDPTEKAPDEVLRWLRLALREMDRVDPPVDVQMSDWLKNQTSRRATLGEQTLRFEARLRQSRKSIQKSKELQQILDTSPQLRETLLTRRKETVSVEDLAEILQVAVVPSTGESSDALGRLVRCTKDWTDFEKQAERDEEARKSDMAYQAMKKDLDALKDALTREAGGGSKSIIGATRSLVPQQKRNDFAKSIDCILGRLHVDSEFLPSRLDVKRAKRQSTWHYSTRDNRTLSCLSSGQRSLLGIASLISLNAALHGILWADVLAFDDFTSALDLNQIPRLGGLLRQIAYGAGVSREQGGDYKRQVFLVSHHEDLTNKLLDVLIPPPGRTMKVIYFTGWSSKGPTFEELDVVESSSSASQVRNSLPCLLSKELRRFFTG